MQRAPPWSCSRFRSGFVVASFTCSTFRTGHQFLVPEARSLARRAVLSTFDIRIMIMLRVMMNTIVVIIMIVVMVIHLLKMMIMLKVPSAGHGQSGQCVQYGRLLSEEGRNFLPLLRTALTFRGIRSNLFIPK